MIRSGAVLLLSLGCAAAPAVLVEPHAAAAAPEERRGAAPPAGEVTRPAPVAPANPRAPSTRRPRRKAPAPGRSDGAGQAEAARKGAEKARARGPTIAHRARRLVGVSSLRRVTRRVPDDCTGLVLIAYRAAGVDLYALGSREGENGVTAMYRRARAAGALHTASPSPGDLVFFRETYDRNRDGLRNDGLTHVGVVERLEAGGTVVFIHRGGKGVVRSRMNLSNPRIHRTKRSKGGRILNDYLRRASKTTRAYVTGELFAGFASPDRL